MLNLLEAKQSKNKVERGWIYVIQQLIKFKESVEEKLNFDPEDRQPISSAAKRRRTGEGPSV